MSVNLITMNSFSGGLNLQDHPFALNINELREAQDVVIDGKGRARRRSGFANRDPLTDFSDTPLLIGRFAYQRATRGIFTVIAHDDYTTVEYAADNTTTGALFRYTNVATTADSCQGWTPGSAINVDSKLNTLIVTCDAFTVGINIRTSSAYTAGTHQFHGTLTRGGTDYYYLVTVIADDGGDFKTPDGVSTYTVEKQINGTYTTCASAGHRTWLAGWNKAPQNYVWSHGTASTANPNGLDDSLKWRADGDGNPKDMEQLPTSESGHIVALREYNHDLAIIKENNIFVLTANAAQDDWVLSKRADVGTTYLRSVAVAENKIIFSNKQGVYAFTGQDVYCISDAKVGDYWRSLMRSSGINWPVNGLYHDGYYMASITNSDNDHIETLVCDISKGFGNEIWTRFTNMDIRGYCLTENGTSTYALLYDVGRDEPNRIVNIGRVFADANSILGHTDSKYLAVDAAPRDGSTYRPVFKLNTGTMVIGDAAAVQRWKRILIDYESSPAGDSGFQVKPILGLDPDTVPETTWPLITPSSDILPGNDSQTRARCFYSLETNGLGFAFEQTGDPDRVVLSAIEIGYKPMRPGRL